MNLAAYHALSQQLVLIGTWNTSTRPAGFDVTSVEVVGASLGFPRGARTGANERFDVDGPAGAFAATFLAFGSGFVPVFGTALLLNPSILIQIDSGTLDAQGNRRFDLPIPANAALAGLNVWTQAVIVPASGLPYTSNPGRTTIDR